MNARGRRRQNKMTRGDFEAMCENLEKCPFYQGQMSMDSGIGSMYKKRYCEGNRLLCARYMVSSKLGKEFVPSTLCPNMTEQAQEILAQHGK